MKQEFIKQYQGEADVFKALSHPTRLFILHAIKEKAYSVSQLAEVIGIDTSTMSKHLDILKRYKLIEGTKERSTVYYQLTIPCLFDFISCARKITDCPDECSEIQCIAKEIR
ncbi:MAG: ArsR/SmtB family transcription factor [Marinilabilia sp.]